MLGQHVAENLKDLPFLRSIIVAPIDNHPCAKYWREAGYDILINESASDGQATSVSLAARHARSLEASALCICLADMPFITAAHVGQLATKYHSHDGAQTIASSDGDHSMPPAIFPASRFEEMVDLKGDKGARKLLFNADIMTFEKSNMLDIDTPADLTAAESLF